MMLRNRSRTVFGKQSPLVADHPRSSQPSPPTQNHRRNGVSSWFGSTFGGFSPSSRFCSETTKTMMSPALFLDVRRVSALRTHPPVRPPEGKKRSWQDFESQGGIGLAIVGNMFNKVPEKNGVKPNRNLVLYGLTIRTSIPSPPPPPPPPVSTFGPLEYPSDFRENSRNSRHPQGLKSSSRPLTECLSVREMELSEDYTCITFHGPNGRTTHIFDDCVVEKNYFSVLPHKSKPPGNVMLPPHKPKQGKQSFLNFCYTCSKRLEQSEDIYIYRYDLFISCILQETEMQYDLTLFNRRSGWCDLISLCIKNEAHKLQRYGNNGSFISAPQGGQILLQSGMPPPRDLA